MHYTMKMKDKHPDTRKEYTWDLAGKICQIGFERKKWPTKLRYYNNGGYVQERSFTASKNHVGFFTQINILSILNCCISKSESCCNALDRIVTFIKEDSSLKEYLDVTTVADCDIFYECASARNLSCFKKDQKNRETIGTTAPGSKCSQCAGRWLYHTLRKIQNNYHEPLSIDIASSNTELMQWSARVDKFYDKKLTPMRIIDLYEQYDRYIQVNLQSESLPPSFDLFKAFGFRAHLACFPEVQCRKRLDDKAYSGYQDAVLNNLDIAVDCLFKSGWPGSEVNSQHPYSDTDNSLALLVLADYMTSLALASYMRDPVSEIKYYIYLRQDYLEILLKKYKNVYKGWIDDIIEHFTPNKRTDPICVFAVLYSQMVLASQSRSPKKATSRSNDTTGYLKGRFPEGYFNPMKLSKTLESLGTMNDENLYDGEIADDAVIKHCLYTIIRDMYIAKHTEYRNRPELTSVRNMLSMIHVDNPGSHDYDTLYDMINYLMLYYSDDPVNPIRLHLPSYITHAPSSYFRLFGDCFAIDMMANDYKSKYGQLFDRCTEEDYFRLAFPQIIRAKSNGED